MDGILGARDGVLDVLGGVRAGDEDAVGAEVEGLLNANAVVRAADADDCLRAARVRRRDDMAQSVVDEQEVVAERRAHLSAEGRRGVDGAANLPMGFKRKVLTLLGTV